MTGASDYYEPQPHRPYQPCNPWPTRIRQPQLSRCMINSAARLRFHVWLLPVAWFIPALYLAFQRSTKLSHFIFESFSGHWMRTWLAGDGGYVHVAVPLLAGLSECIVLGFLMDFCHIRRRIYAFTTPFVVFGVWNAFPPAGSFAFFCVFVGWGLYAVGLFSVAGGLTLKIIRRIRESRARHLIS